MSLIKNTVKVCSIALALLTGCSRGVVESLKLPSSATERTINEIVLSPSNPTLQAGATQAFRALAIDTDNVVTDITNQVSWVSQNASVAVFNSNQSSIASGITAGVASFTISYRGKAVMGTITVTSASLTSIQVAPGNFSMANGSTKNLVATASYSDGTRVDITSQVAWTSSNPSVASVSNSPGLQGQVLGASPGVATITAVVGGVVGSATLTVTAAQLSSIVLSPGNSNGPVGVGQQFSAMGFYDDGSSQNITDLVVWSSPNNSVIDLGNAFNNKGYARMLAAGVATVSATLGSMTTSTTYTVNNLMLNSIQIFAPSANIDTGVIQLYQAMGTYSDGSVVDISNQVTWSTANSAVATISNLSGSQGLLTPAGVGVTQVVGTLGAIVASVGLTVVPPAVVPPALVSVVVGSAASSAPLGLSQQFQAIGTYSDGSTQDLTNGVTWSSSNPSALSVSDSVGSKGLANTLSLGSVVVSAVIGAVTGTKNFTVDVAALSSISISSSASSITNGSSQTYQAMGTYSDARVVDISNLVLWSVGSNSIASISNAIGSKGLLSSTGVGSTQVTATLGPISAVVSLNVSAGPSPTLLSISITPAAQVVSVGLSQQFTAVGTYSDGSTRNITNTVLWNISSGIVGTINSGGLFVGVGIGNTTVNATLEGVSSSVTINVTL